MHELQKPHRTDRDSDACESSIFRSQLYRISPAAAAAVAVATTTTTTKIVYVHGHESDRERIKYFVKWYDDISFEQCDLLVVFAVRCSRTAWHGMAWHVTTMMTMYQ